MNAWKVPISTQHPTQQWVSHLMPDTTLTHTLAETACGMTVNPGFARKPKPGTSKCLKCLKKEMK